MTTPLLNDRRWRTRSGPGETHNLEGLGLMIVKGIRIEPQKHEIHGELNWDDIGNIVWHGGRR